MNVFRSYNVFDFFSANYEQVILVLFIVIPINAIHL